MIDRVDLLDGPRRVGASTIQKLIERLMAIGATPEIIGIAVEAVVLAARAPYGARSKAGTNVEGPLNRTRRPQYWVWQETRRQVFSRDGFQCSYCPETGDELSLTIDHIVPISRGGSNDLDNLCVACKPCNSSKKDRLLSEWRAGQ